MYVNKRHLWDRRALRHRKTLSVGPRIFLVVIVASIGIVWMLAAVMLVAFEQRRGGISSKHYGMLSQGFIDVSIDLWPSDKQSNILLDMLVSCLPSSEFDETCQQKRQSLNIQRIALVRPPGLISSVMEDFVTELVETHPMKDDRAELIPVAFVPADHSFTKVIRFAVLPSLLEAADLIFETLDSSFTKEQVTISDLEDVVRLLIHWHCRQSHIADDTAMLTISTKQVMSRPNDCAKGIGKFIGFSIGKGEDMMCGKSADRRAAQAIVRIDECSDFVSKLQKQNPRANLQVLVDSVIRDTIVDDKCGRTDTHEQWQRRRVSHIASQLLGPDSHTICDEYPMISPCSKASPH